MAAVIVEITGLSSAGKSTMINAIQAEVGTTRVVTGAGRLLRLIGAEGVSQPLVRRVLLISLTPIGWLVAGREAIPTGVAIFRAHRASALPARSFVRFNGTFNALQQFGWFFLLRRVTKPDEIVLLDTGPVHTLYNFFVDPDRTAETGAVDAYLCAVPVADAVVWLQAERDLIVTRTLSRTHRRVKQMDRSQAEAFHDNASDVFAQLEQLSRFDAVLVRVHAEDVAQGSASARSILAELGRRSAIAVDD